MSRYIDLSCSRSQVVLLAKLLVSLDAIVHLNETVLLLVTIVELDLSSSKFVTQLRYHVKLNRSFDLVCLSNRQIDLAQTGSYVRANASCKEAS